ncbi:hypothetical protein SLEP1_g43320 [Rubroshorea leprosula]|uniref:Homeobox domain-containing protein n=1 Tax=Rubroshorea leprosula TaxID=152421 RepID=A0AAV5LD07_9ROSI|nr:hypothetical protein SLEP1_g43320 [Rubroshorea leprosula]
MATYFHGGSEFQDGMQTLYLMNPSYVPYPDTHPPAAAANMLFLNPAGNALNASNLSHAPSPSNHHQFVGLPLPTPTVAIGPPNSDGMVPSVQYNLWGSNVDQNSPGHHPQIVSAASPGGAHDVSSHQLGVRRPVVSPTRQGLSLSLSSQQTPYRTSSNVEPAIQGQGHSGHSPSSVSAVSSGVSGMQSVVLGSKYLRAAQQLLDEVVNVGKAIKSNVAEGTKEKIIKMDKESAAAATGEGSSAAGGEDSFNKRAAELTTAQRQELQMKKAKLVNMLDEVEQRYRQYHHQMQAVVSSFEQAAGLGSAKSYTALALQTISKQFRCLKDTISGQIKATSKSLGEEDSLGVKVEGSRLRYVDHQLRQQRALQQLGMIHHNAWRPQRGLPERAVSVLRSWLFEHFLHPYPKDSDKHLLAKQTGLTRSQVSNWFINARVRLWKPMVEEMYVEEMKEQEKNGNEEGSSKNEHNDSGSISAVMKESVSHKMDHATQPKPGKPRNPSTTCQIDFSSAPISTSAMASFEPQATGFNLIGARDMEGVAHRSPKKPRSVDMQNSPSSILSMDMDVKFQGDERLITSSTDHRSGGFGYPIEDQMGRFNTEQQLLPRFHGNGVSLTLGLPHFSGNQQNFLAEQNIQLGRRLGLGTGESDFCGINTASASHSATAGYQNIEMQSRKRFAAQLLPDFVA